MLYCMVISIARCITTLVQVAATFHTKLHSFVLRKGVLFHLQCNVIARKVIGRNYFYFLALKPLGVALLKSSVLFSRIC